MSEKIVDLGGVIDPADFYGPGNANYDRLAAKFPELKIVGRGSVLKLIGAEAQIARFEERFGQLAAYYGRYGHVSPEVIDQIFDVPTTLRTTEAVAMTGEGAVSGSAGTVSGEDVIVYGNNGTVVRARTENQR